MPRGDCKHCGKVNIYLQGRGLCNRCHRTPEIKAQYAKLREVGEYDGVEPTAEQVEQMVAEQMANLPDWWFDDAKRRGNPTFTEQRQPKIYTLSSAPRQRHE